MNLKSIFKTGTVNWPEYYKNQQSKAKDERLIQFYQQGLVDPKTPLSQVPFVAVDFETTGLDPKKDGIISIGLVPFTLNRIQLNRATHWIVNPDKPLDEESVVIHGITHSDIIDAPDLTNILEGLLEALAGTVVVVHYRKIEREFLDLALKSRIGEGILFPVIDTLELEANVQRKQSSGLINILKGKKPESVRLGSSRSRYGLPAYSPHHALTDAIATAELLQAQIAHHYAADTPIQQLWK
ncbi:DNA polymerase III subunit epsilon [Vibrio albus]|uniref:DNA-directed DNA polymerase n=1 Tax=Vibrio albus TaxID=2200953 RepID=A0A2U3BDF5_9VIBR|nr:3'-5' exonuclease [Vibrio albus]PWI34782.1 DNA polymerase III subunit epsilon [Vibrio albus]